MRFEFEHEILSRLSQRGYGQAPVLVALIDFATLVRVVIVDANGVVAVALVLVLQVCIDHITVRHGDWEKRSREQY